ncbi:hypothetical protein MTHERMOG20_23490 [Moorella thermoacetica]|uniref:Plasmid segregation actin-type ATPase ParM n=1 Tax=Moorella thermoacetica (strain ATCC 39073 / JCM 9320) TaxID=264732 RepID=Q2RLL0_MOOTA|nr:ParM/StbA family protein [Moorella thermoacetica]AKX95737.1 hypothetical protein MOTHA_c03680 [Moorella thermoacetica]OIQ54571.1 hypothetical protein MOCA_22400 [Moorella thermoacetica]QCZ99547.1 hypothetical protein MothHH_00377 [Moorella thermoacetica]TYL07206.1 hypothetical protein MOOCA_23140 [Moorella thermoacetica]TYL07573.1 hypothetical protein MOLA_22340 [Moorella thermoacetica]
MLAIQTNPQPAALAIDVGFGYTKAVSSTGGKVIFPSVVAPAGSPDAFDRLDKSDTGYRVRIKKGIDGLLEEWLVGELALKEGREVQYFQDWEKHSHPAHDAVLLAAAVLTWNWPRAGSGIMGISNPALVVGLPVDVWRDELQREGLKKHLAGLAAEVSVNGNDPVRVTFSRVYVYPQAAGAFLTVPDLPDSGIVALVDVGQKTTDSAAIEIVNGRQRLVKTMCFSINKGMAALVEAVREEFRRQTGAPLPPQQAWETVKSGSLWYRGKQIDMAPAIKKARSEIARAIADQVLAGWGERADFVRKVYLAGGGILDLPDLKNMFPAAAVLPGPQWANALGFLKVARGLAV